MLLAIIRKLLHFWNQRKQREFEQAQAALQEIQRAQLQQERQLQAEEGERAVRLRNESVLKEYQILHDARNAKQGARKLCWFSHFDEHGRVDDHVIYYLEALRKLGFEIQLFSTSPGLAAEQVSRLAPLCSLVVLRPNLGMDFCSWKLASSLTPELSSYEELLLANDSVYGPLFDLGEAFTKMSAVECDLWGITDSWFTQYHLQSYFLLARRSFFASPYFKEFFRQVEALGSKQDIIMNFELGLTRGALAAGFRVEALCDFRKIYRLAYNDQVLADRLNHHSHETNPTIYYWETLLREFRCPFLKISLIRDNLLSRYQPWDFNQLFQEIGSTYPERLIIGHEKRTSRGFFP